MRYNYFVIDEYGDVWNIEPLPTFNQAFQFRGIIRLDLNSPRTLSIRSELRETVMVPVKVSHTEYKAGGDF